MNLHIAESATLLGKPYAVNYHDYYPEIPIEYVTRTNKYCRRALIYAYDQDEIKISGKGLIDLQGPTWKKIFYEIILDCSERPIIIFMRRCRDICVSDLKLRNSVAYTNVYDQCRNLTVENLDLYVDVIENNDGISIFDCSHVKILNNKIFGDDDTICMKSMCAVGLKDILIQGNVLYSVRANGIKLGTDSSGPVDDVQIYDNLVMAADKAAFSWESVDGSHTNNLHVKNLEVPSAA